MTKLDTLDDTIELLTKQMLEDVFNNLKGNIEDYWDDDNNELRRCE